MSNTGISQHALAEVLQVCFVYIFYLKKTTFNLHKKTIHHSVAKANSTSEKLLVKSCHKQQVKSQSLEDFVCQ
jgi:hypothetical protein